MYTHGQVVDKAPEMITIAMSKELVKKLRDVYALSERERSEYVGAIKFNRINDAWVKYNSPMKYTNGNPMSVVPPEYMRDNFIMYHSHPIPVNPQLHTSLISLPSLSDFKYYVNNYPTLQANIILERNGFYMIDIIESSLNNKPDPDRAYTAFRYLLELKKINAFAVPDPNGFGLALFKVSITTWKKLINVYIDRVMRHKFNMSIKYYTYDDVPVMTILNPATITTVRVRRPPTNS